MSAAFLRVESGGSPVEVPLGLHPVSIGRHAANTIVLEDEAASRHHCVIEPTPVGFLVRDLSSRNGTLLNGRPIRSAALAPGDVVGIGDARVRLVAGTPSVPPTPAAAPTPAPTLSRPSAGPTAAFTATPPYVAVGAAPAWAPAPTAQRPPSPPTPAAPLAPAPAPPSPPAPRPASLTVSPLPPAPPARDRPTAVSSSSPRPPWRGEASPTNEIEQHLADAEARGESANGVLLSKNDLVLLGARGEVLHGETDPRTAGTVQALRGLLFECTQARATDIHMEPKGEHFLVRMRVDGMMVEAGRAYPDVGERMQRVVKVLSDIDIAHPNVVQEGHFSALLGQRKIDYRISFTPAMRGQKLVVRVLDPALAPRGVADLRLPNWMREHVERVTRQDQGMLLVCGPTGCGKTTTLYAALRGFDSAHRNVVTIEDPVEYEVEGITQFPVDASKGNTTIALLRSILRQDPDVIFVGEIRDPDTARTALQASMTGHLVLSTVHVRDSLGSVFRLMDLGLEPYMIASGLNLVLSQRLVRLLCPTCKQPRRPEPREAQALGNRASPVQQVFRPVGCGRCFRTGYAGRRAIFELLIVSDELKSAIMATPTFESLRKALGRTTFVSLRDSGYDLVADGASSVEEIERVVGVDLG
ncbi:MAG: Flp pilus assembly complex ATPase component TadA [Planctomycetes bacterium]|nr:Flp pilus assembly complex ATPase component TadA [Planctomycetota bacterium]